MLIPLEVTILDPKHDAVKGYWNENHDREQLPLRVTSQTHLIHCPVPNCQNVSVHRNLLEEDHNLSDEDTACPYEDLKNPYAHFNLAIRITFCQRYLLVRIDAALKNLRTLNHQVVKLFLTSI